MRDRGDFVPSLDTQIVSPPKIITAFSNKLPEIKRLSPSGDHIGISGGGSHLTKVRMQKVSFNWLDLLEL